MRIRLKSQQGSHPTGSEHDVIEIIPHGGNYDDACQYVLTDQTYVPENKADLIDGA